MLVFNEADEAIDPRAAWRRLLAAVHALGGPDHDAVTAILIDAGEL